MDRITKGPPTTSFLHYAKRPALRSTRRGLRGPAGPWSWRRVDAPRDCHAIFAAVVFRESVPCGRCGVAGWWSVSEKIPPRLPHPPAPGAPEFASLLLRFVAPANLRSLAAMHAATPPRKTRIRGVKKLASGGEIFWG